MPEPTVLEFERDVLAGAGAEVSTLTTFGEAKCALENGKFDAVIINGKMPGAGSVQQTHQTAARLPRGDVVGVPHS